MAPPSVWFQVKTEPNRANWPPPLTFRGQLSQLLGDSCQSRKGDGLFQLRLVLKDGFS